MTLLLTTMAVVLVTSFLCSLGEACLLSTTHSQIAEMLQARKQAGRVWLRLKEKIERPISAILALNTTVNAAGGMVLGHLFSVHYGERMLFGFSVLFTILLLFLSEILPKTLGVRYRTIIAPWIALPLRALMKAFRPVTWLTEHFAGLFYSKDVDDPVETVAREINSLVALARISGTISTYEEHLIRESFNLTEMTVAEVMIPIDDLAVISSTMSLREALATAQLAGHSRYPLIEGENRNRVLGYVTFKDLANAVMTEEVRSVQELVRPVLALRPSVAVSTLLKQFVDSHEHISLVTSLEQAVLGMVTFEDILEEIVGEVQDAYDRLPRTALFIDNSNWIVGGGIRMDELRTKVGIQAASIENSREQLAAWLVEQLGRRPHYNDRVALGGFEFKVRRMRRGKASEIKLTRIG